jgi:hypothetical protein
MASYPVAAGEVGVHDKALIASTVDTVTFDRDCDEVEVLAEGSGNVYFTVDGSTPTVSGQNTYKVPAGQAITVRVPTPGDTVVKLISSTTPTYDVTSEL